MANISGNRHEDFEDFTLQKVKTGWLVTVKGEHKLKGAWHFKRHDDALDFLTTGLIPRPGGRHSPVSTFFMFIFAATVLFILLYLFLWAA